jgi:hypothetical protein
MEELRIKYNRTTGQKTPNKSVMVEPDDAGERLFLDT